MQLKIITYTFFTSIILLNSCGITEPFVDSRREAGKNIMIGESKPDNIVICYNGLSDEISEIQKIADKECDKTGKKAEFVKSKTMSCRLLLPSRAYFKCVKKDGKEEKTDSQKKLLSEKKYKMDDKNQKNLSSEIMPNYDPMTYEDMGFE